MMTILKSFRIVLISACAFGIAWCDEMGLPGFNINPDTVSELDVNAYMGRWYEMYSSIIPKLTFEKDGFCVTADYFKPFLSSTGVLQFEVVNSLNEGSPTGELSQVTGTATNDNPDDEPGKFKLQFEESSNTGDYWILEVGDMVNGQYPWAIVSTPLCTSLFVLARDVNEFNTVYKDDVLQEVEDLGFTIFINEPIETFQSTLLCTYAPLPQQAAIAETPIVEDKEAEEGIVDDKIEGEIDDEIQSEIDDEIEEEIEDEDDEEGMPLPTVPPSIFEELQAKSLVGRTMGYLASFLFPSAAANGPLRHGIHRGQKEQKKRRRQELLRQQHLQRQQHKHEQRTEQQQ